MKNTLTLICIALFAFTSCREDSDTFDGPSIADIYNDFSILENFAADKDSVDFSTGQSVTFSAKFSKIVDWKITIVGNSSKAKKIISGQSKNIDLSNALWNGSTTEYPIFKIENCKASLTIVDVADTFDLDIKIIKAKMIDGFIIANFENGLNPLWTKFIQSGANMDFKVKTDSVAPEGAKYLNMAGTVNWDYLIGLIDYPASAYGSYVTYPLSTNPSAEYFNCLIYGVPNTNPSIVLFQFKEDENADGTFNANNEDQYDLQINVNWSGWKLVSAKYSELTTLVNGAPATPKGNGLQNPDKLSKISMLHLADPNNGFASTKIDLIVFTSNAPIEP